MLSVIISVYNEEKYLKQCLDSIKLNFSASNELIIVDDCSNDNTTKIINEFKPDGYKKIFIKNSEKKGLARNLNLALSLANNEFIARMDGDDICNPERFVKQLKIIKENPNISILGTNARLIDHKSKIIGITNLPIRDIEIKKKLAYTNPLIHPSIMFRKSEILKIGGYNEKIERAQDFELWYRAKKKSLVFRNLEETLLDYRIGKKISLNKRLKIFKLHLIAAIRDLSPTSIILVILIFCKEILVFLNLYKPRTYRKDKAIPIKKTK